ncbi:hypothetical protein BsWGS_28742 [Bradybaena similaris]
MGIEAPMLPPMMPQSLRAHLYPQQRQLDQHRLQLQKQSYMAYLTSQQQRQTKVNPYTLSSGSYAGNQRAQPRSNSVYSSANRIRIPGSANSVGTSKGNPYGSSYNGATSKATSSRGSGNPYSNSRGPARAVPPLRNSASYAPVPIPAHATRLMRTMKTLQAVREQPMKMTDAQSVGCRLPSEAMASVVMYSDCRNAAARMVCQAEMMTCVNVGVSSLCCPYGMNGLALDTVGYVNRLQQFVEGFA